MTYPVELPLSRQFGNGISTVFPAGFELFALTDLVVELRDTNDHAVTIVLNGSGTYDYIVGTWTYDVVTERYSNVAIHFNTAPPNGYKIGLARAGVQSQTLDLTSGGGLPAESLERRLDRLVSLIQDLEAKANRALLGPVGSASVVDAGGRIIRNAADPVDDQDLVTKLYLTAGTLSINQIEGVTVSSYAALRALAVGGSEPVTAFVTGAVSSGDGGDGFYYYDANSTATDSVNAITPNSGVGRWLLDSATKAGHGSIKKSKLTETSRSSDTTPHQDPHLWGWFLEPNVTYEIAGFLIVDAAAGAGNLKFNFTSSQVQRGGALWAEAFNTNTIKQDSVSNSLADKTFFITAGFQTFIKLTGSILTNTVNSGQTDFYWSQVTSDPNGVRLNPGSWINFTRNP